MPPWAERQRDFAAAILDPSRPPPEGIVGPDGAACPKRFAVYRNNVVVGLVDVLEESFPAVRRLVGHDFFRAMAAEYVRRDPPTSPVLLEYGAGLARFIQGFPPARELPYLADVARLERLWLDAYHAPDADPLEAPDFAAVPADRLGELRIELHPSLGVLRSPHPVLAIWRANIEEEDPGPLELDGGGEDLLVIRPEADVAVRAMPPGAAEFLQALAQGCSVAEAFGDALGAAPRFDLAAALGQLIAAGAFVGYELDGAEPAGAGP